MGRWQPEPRSRLERAAFELFAEQGFDRTTVAEIAARAGLTERTFFRHFVDKREVMFSGSEALRGGLVTAVASAPPSAGAFELIATALAALAEPLEPRRAFARLRVEIIMAHPELRERELIKLASLASTLAEALRGRGVAEPCASVAAETAIGVFRAAFDRWTRDDAAGTFAETIRSCLAALGDLTARS